MKRQNVYGVSESMGGNLDYYTVYATFDFTPTGDYNDQSQKYFDQINMMIAMRTQITINSVPVSVADLALEGSTLTGAGWVWNFSTEHREAFASHFEGIVVDDVAILKTMFDEVYIDSNLTIDYGLNFEVKRMENL